LLRLAITCYSALSRLALDVHCSPKKTQFATFRGISRGKGEGMTNYEQLFQAQMQDPQFVKAYYEARVERIVDEMLDTLKDKIVHNERKETLIRLIDSMQQQIHSTLPQESSPSHSTLAILEQC
jgi:hypothetical protein